MLAKGTIVIYIEKGSFQEAYCVGESQPFILCDYDDDSEVAKHIREATTKDIVPGFLEDDIEEERAKRRVCESMRTLRMHLRRLTSQPMLTDENTHEGWSVCDYCGMMMHTAQVSAKDTRNHRATCVWALAKKALADAD